MNETPHAPTETYKSFLNALNRQDLEAAAACVDIENYRENCVAFTQGFVDWTEAKASLQTVWRGIPDLHVELYRVSGGEGFAIAHGLSSGTAKGKLYGAPATGKRYESSFFDYVEFNDQGLIVYRVQQADVLGQMRQLYGKGMGAFGVSALLFKQPATYPKFGGPSVN